MYFNEIIDRMSRSPEQNTLSLKLNKSEIDNHYIFLLKLICVIDVKFFLHPFI